MKKSIGKPYERKVHVRFDEGGADILYSTLILKEIRTVWNVRLYSTAALKETE
jgi:hypothetical protein